MILFGLKPGSAVMYRKCHIQMTWTLCLGINLVYLSLRHIMFIASAEIRPLDTQLASEPLASIYDALISYENGELIMQSH